MSLLSVLLCVYGIIALCILIYVVLAALFAQGGSHSLIPYYFGYVHKQHGICSLIIEGSVLALLWLPLILCVTGIYVHSLSKKKQKTPRK